MRYSGDRTPRPAHSLHHVLPDSGSLAMALPPRVPASVVRPLSWALAARHSASSATGANSLTHANRTGCMSSSRMVMEHTTRPMHAVLLTTAETVLGHHWLAAVPSSFRL